MATFSQMSKYISAGIVVGVLSLLGLQKRPSEKKYMDKEMCDKVKQAAEAVAVGAKEVRSTSQYVKDTLTPDAGKIVSDLAKKAIAGTSEASDETEKKKDTQEKVAEVMSK